MAERHFYNEHAGLVEESLKGVVASHPSLRLVPKLKVVFDSKHDANKVSLISGGGSGHEPFGAGFVGKGLFSAVAAGDIFASPSAKQISAAIKSVPSNVGTLVIVKNYTGDNLHFGLAVQQARAEGLAHIEIVTCADDAAIGRQKGALVGRRALTGTVLIAKIAGAASDEGVGFSDCVKLAKATASQTVSATAALNHCHVPGRAEFAQIAQDTLEIGLGIHNEPGRFTISPQPKLADVISDLLKLLCDPKDEDRAYVTFKPDDEIALVLNNMGGVSVLEMSAFLAETLKQLKETWGITPARVYNGAFVTSLNMPGVCISLLNVSGIARDIGTPTDSKTVFKYLDAPHETLGWPSTSHFGASKAELVPIEEKLDDYEPTLEANDNGIKVQVDSKQLASAIRSAAQHALDIEDKLTKWDTIVGDGDCGETVASGAKAALESLDAGLGSDGNVAYVLRVLTDKMDGAMGGTLGAIFSILLAALATQVRQHASKDQGGNLPWPEIVSGALETLKGSTSARVGHRTVLDAIIPFAEEFKSSGDFERAVAAAQKGAQNTSGLAAKLGRASYVGEIAPGDMPPDPGAMAFAAIVEGLLAGSR